MRIPKYRRHSTGQATVHLNGRDHYLGKYDSPESPRNTGPFWPTI